MDIPKMKSFNENVIAVVFLKIKESKLKNLTHKGSSITDSHTVD
jgi:hypothetical protein